MTQPTHDTPARPHNGRLAELLGVLSSELHGEVGAWAARQHRGRTIALTLQADGRRVIRISREDRPQGVVALNRWRNELDVIRLHLGCSMWEEKPVPDLSTAAWWVETMVTK